LKDPIAQEVVAKYMNLFYKKSRTDRMLTVMDWIRYTKRGNGIKPMYYLPFSNDDSSEYYQEETEEVMKTLSFHKVCRSALRVILDFGRVQWGTAEKCVDTCCSPTHGLRNRRSNNGLFFDKHVKDDLYAFFSEQELMATPQATRIVREIAGTGLRDGEEGVVELPPSFSKRSMYYRFIGGRGYDVQIDARGNIKAKQKTGELLACQPICSWFTFRQFWKVQFPLLRLQVRYSNLKPSSIIIHSI